MCAFFVNEDVIGSLLTNNSE